MDQLDMVLFIVVVLITMIFIRKMFKNVAQIAGMVILVIFVYTLFSGNADFLTNPDLETIFQNNNITTMQQRYCSNDTKRSKAVCSCIIEPVYQELYRMYPEYKIKEIEANQGYLSNEVERIIDRKRSDIQLCLDKNQANTLGILEKFRKSRDIWNL